MEEKWFQYKECLNRLRLFSLEGQGGREKKENANNSKKTQTNPNKLSEEKSTGKKKNYK